MPQPRKNPHRGPCRYLRHPEQFGHADPPVCRSVPASRQFELRAAQVQHEFARRVREQLVRLDLRPDKIALQIGLSPEQFNRLLRGESALSLARIHQIAKAVALDVTVNLEAME